MNKQKIRLWCEILLQLHFRIFHFCETIKSFFAGFSARRIKCDSQPLQWQAGRKLANRRDAVRSIQMHSDAV